MLIHTNMPTLFCTQCPPRLHKSLKSTNQPLKANAGTTHKKVLIWWAMCVIVTLLEKIHRGSSGSAWCRMAMVKLSGFAWPMPRSALGFCLPQMMLTSFVALIRDVALERFKDALPQKSIQI